MQSNTVASFTNTVDVAADEVRALLGIAARNFAGIVDGQNGVKLLSSDVVVQADGSATVAIVYQQAVPLPTVPEQPVVTQTEPVSLAGLDGLALTPA